MPSLLDPLQRRPAPLYLVDDHDAAYILWKEHGIKNQVLLHFDAHIDFEWIADKDPFRVLQEKNLANAMDDFKHSHGWSFSDTANNFLHLGNYLCRALQDGIVKDWYWIVPDSVWENKQSRRQIWRDLLHYYRFRTGPMDFPKKERHAFRASFFNVPFTVTSLKHLPQMAGPVLLNIDVDYLTTEMLPEVPSAENLRRRLPWVWPDELMSRLRRAGIRSLMTTLSNSVQGGFTPIQFKFFGEALKGIESGHLNPDYFHLKEAFEFYAAKKDHAALLVLDSFESCGIYEATRQYRKAQLLYGAGQIVNAQESMKTAISLDSEFASVYNSSAVYFETLGRNLDAYEEWRWIHALLPNHLEARLGKADYWALSGSKDDAKIFYEQALMEDPLHAAAAQKLGNFHRAERRYPQAQHYLALSVVQNPKNIPARLQLASVFMAQGFWSDAKKCLRETLGLGGHCPAAYQMLSAVYFRLGYFRKAVELWRESLRLNLQIFLRNLGARL